MLLRQKLQIFFFIYWLLIVPASFAKKIELFNKNGETVDEYIEFLDPEHLKDGDQIYVSDEKYFIYKGFLGEGNTTKILEVINPKDKKTYALRLPILKANDFFRTLDENVFYINKTIYGYKELKAQNISIPKIIDYEKSKYILIEKINNIAFDFRDFVSQPNNFPERQILEAEDSLEIFVKEVAGFEKIGDLHPGQLVYISSKKRWVLLDWSQTHILTEHINSPTILETLLFKSSLQPYLDEYRIQKIAKKINNTILKQRKFIIEAEDNFIRSNFQSINQTNTVENYIKAYEKRPSQYTQKGQKLLFKYFLDHQKKFNGFEYKVNDLIRLGNTLTQTDQEFYQFAQLAVKKVTKIDDLIFLLTSYGSINDKKILKKLSKLASQQLSRIVYSPGISIPNKHIIEFMNGSNIFAKSDIMTVQNLINRIQPTKRTMGQCILSKLIR